MMKIRTLFYAILLLLFFVNKNFAQRVFTQNTPNSNCYCEMIFEPTAQNPKGVLVIDVGNAAIKLYSLENIYTNLAKDYNILYLKILNQGAATRAECYEVVTNTISSTERIYKSAFYVIQKLEDTKNPTVKMGGYAPSYLYNTIYFDEANVENLEKTLRRASENRPYAMPGADYGDMERIKRMENYKGNKEIGIHWSPLFLTGKKLGLSNNALSPFGIYYTQNLTQHYSVRVNSNIHLNLPDQSGIQSAMQSRVLEAVQNSVDSIYIDESLSGNYMMGCDVTVRFTPFLKKAFRPYAAVGVGAQWLFNTSGRIQDTLDVSNINFSNPSAAAAGGLNLQNGDALSTTKSLLFTPQIEFGFDYRVSPVVKFNVALPFKYFVSGNSDVPNTVAWGLNFGMSFTLNAKKYPKMDKK